MLMYMKKIFKLCLRKKPMCQGEFKHQHTALVIFLLVSLQMVIEQSMQHSLLIIFLQTVIIVLLHHLLGKCLLSISYGQRTQVGVDDHIKQVFWLVYFRITFLFSSPNKLLHTCLMHSRYLEFPNFYHSIGLILLIILVIFSKTLATLCQCAE